MSLELRGFNKHCFEIFRRAQVVHMKIIMKTLSSQNLIILRNFNYWPKFFVSYTKNTRTANWGHYKILMNFEVFLICSISFCIRKSIKNAESFQCLVLPND